ncbi:hypothetical protein HBH64_147860 [Parastagonospora nodorum]|nr:hypothetical protein HBH64_147860 [Parastagonospora nodorum]KAH4792980.1 hypothetical protein HBH65_038150 [Parastagonospora nodorum]
MCKCIRTADARRIVRGLENSASTSLLVYSDHALQECSLPKVTAAYALNYLKLQVLKLKIPRRPTLVGIVLYNAIKEYYDDRTRKTIYFYGYTIEDNYNAICEKTGYSNEEDIEADEREEETRVRLRKLLKEIHDILLREFRRANDFTKSDEFAITV